MMTKYFKTVFLLFPFFFMVILTVSGASFGLYLLILHAAKPIYLLGIVALASWMFASIAFAMLEIEKEEDKLEQQDKEFWESIRGKDV